MHVSRRLPLSVVAAAILVLNLADALFTLVYVHVGVAEESNPFMETAMLRGPVGFMVVKLALVSLGVLLLFRLRQRPSATAGLVGAAVAYAGLFLYHLSGVPALVSVAGS